MLGSGMTSGFPPLYPGMGIYYPPSYHGIGGLGFQGRQYPGMGIYYPPSYHGIGGLAFQGCTPTQASQISAVGMNSGFPRAQFGMGHPMLPNGPVYPYPYGGGGAWMGTPPFPFPFMPTHPTQAPMVAFNRTTQPYLDPQAYYSAMGPPQQTNLPHSAIGQLERSAESAGEELEMSSVVSTDETTGDQLDSSSDYSIDVVA